MDNKTQHISKSDKDVYHMRFEKKQRKLEQIIEIRSGQAGWRAWHGNLGE